VDEEYLKKKSYKQMKICRQSTTKKIKGIRRGKTKEITK